MISIYMAGANDPTGERSRVEMAGFCNVNRAYTGPILACKVMFAQHMACWQYNTMLRWYVSRSYDAAFTGLYMKIMDKHFPLQPRQIVQLRQLGYGFMMWRVSYECNRQTELNELDYYMANALVQMKDLCAAMTQTLPNIETMAEDAVVLATLKNEICFLPDTYDDPGKLITCEQNRYYITACRGINDICAKAGSMAQSEGCIGIIVRKLLTGATPVLKQLQDDPRYRNHYAVLKTAVDDAILFTRDEHAILTFLNNDIIKAATGPKLYHIGWQENEVIFPANVLMRIKEPPNPAINPLLPNCRTLKGEHGNVPEFRRALLQLEASGVVSYRSLVDLHGKATLSPYHSVHNASVDVHADLDRRQVRVDRNGLMDDNRIFGSVYAETHDNDITPELVAEWKADLKLDHTPKSSAKVANQESARSLGPSGKRRWKSKTPLVNSMTVQSKFVLGAINEMLFDRFGYIATGNADTWNPTQLDTNAAVKARAMRDMLDACMQFSGERSPGEIFVSGAPPGGGAAYTTHTVALLDEPMSFNNPRRYAANPMKDMEPEPDNQDNLDDEVCDKTKARIDVPNGGSTLTRTLLGKLRPINLVV
tara:strand:- start:2400 stop:4181 length:1782 start_codon:yes stop_codon:yes gene_type:complete